VFKGCSGLTSVTIPSSVTSIGSEAFYDCSGLTSVHVEAATPPTLSSNTFEGNAAGRRFYVPANPATVVDDYKAALQWIYYKDFIFAEGEP
jgi:hypothetical protein